MIISGIGVVIAVLTIVLSVLGIRVSASVLPIYMPIVHLPQPDGTLHAAMPSEQDAWTDAWERYWQGSGEEPYRELTPDGSLDGLFGDSGDSGNVGGSGRDGGTDVYTYGMISEQICQTLAPVAVLAYTWDVPEREQNLRDSFVEGADGLDVPIEQVRLDSGVNIGPGYASLIINDASVFCVVETSAGIDWELYYTDYERNEYKASAIMRGDHAENGHADDGRSLTSVEYHGLLRPECRTGGPCAVRCG
ncbi:hypothetical protein [Bifidobacterium sp. SO4]|uniref:hypothetical protein n=1 Tax=Bifidobacterium sp. SO4 TaxID=2809030 RepID=UPI001BDC9AB0|nr:hypothetical protein [Bifidobacterium sp. SO4]MBT1170164.1 hypothetical protein [Bifidobacterium sp. SO4]